MAPKKEKANPIEKFQPVTYVCRLWPFLGLGGGIKFNQGVFRAETQEQADRVERADGFGGVIKKVASKRSATTVEESAIAETIAQIQAASPQVRRGMVSSKGM